MYRYQIFKSFIYLYKLRLNTKKLVLKLNSRFPINLPTFIYPVLNTSIISNENHLTAVSRVSNAGFEDYCDFVGRPLQSYRIVGSKLQNGIIKYDLSLDGQVTNLEFLHEITTIPNYEDPRIFLYQGKEYVVMTKVKSPVGDNTSPWKSCVVIQDILTKQTTEIISPFSKGIEKNWVPVEDTDKITLLYGSNPIVKIEFYDSLFNPEVILTKYKSQLFLNNRTQVVKTTHPFIPYIRVVSKKYAIRRFGYTPLHYFEILSRDLKPIRLSNPFVFSSRKQEFCQGLAIKNSKLYLSWSEQEKYNYLGSIDIEEVLNLFPKKLR